MINFPSITRIQGCWVSLGSLVFFVSSGCFKFLRIHTLRTVRKSDHFKTCMLVMDVLFFYLVPNISIFLNLRISMAKLKDKRMFVIPLCNQKHILSSHNRTNQSIYRKQLEYQ